MSEPRFKMPPGKPAAASQVDEWVTGTKPADVPAPQQQTAGGKAARLTIDLPPELHARFKATCALKGTRMVDQVRSLIEEWMQKNG